jgi:hypothetical protein
MGSISLASNVTILSSHNVEEKDAIIKSLQRELGMLKEQVEEFNDLQMLVIKVTGKNGVRKLKDKYLTTSGKVNANKISYFLHNSIWPHVKLMPEKWHKWNDNPKSICQQIMSVVGVPSRFTKEDYWMGVVRSLANDELCAMRSNMKQGLFNQFKGMILFVDI